MHISGIKVNSHRTPTKTNKTGAIAKVKILGVEFIREIGSPRFSKNEPILKIFCSLYDGKQYPVHKQTESGLEIAFYHFFKFKRLVLLLQLFECFILEYISFCSSPSPKRYDYMRL